MAFQFSHRVVLLDTPHNREGRRVGAAGLVAGIAYEQEDHGETVGYAVMLDEDGMTYFVLPDGVAPEHA